MTQPYYYIVPTQSTYPQSTYQPQLLQYIVPIITGLMMMVVLAGMVRDLFKGQKVELPF